jgi:hypothetical protein
MAMGGREVVSARRRLTIKREEGTLVWVMGSKWGWMAIT